MPLKEVVAVEVLPSFEAKAASATEKVRMIRVQAVPLLEGNSMTEEHRTMVEVQSLRESGWRTAGRTADHEETIPHQQVRTRRPLSHRRHLRRHRRSARRGLAMEEEAFAILRLTAGKVVWQGQMRHHFQRLHTAR